MSEDPADSLGKVIQIGESQIRDQFNREVRGTAEEALNGLLDAKAGRPRHFGFQVWQGDCA